jgi:hypothetical protein
MFLHDDNKIEYEKDRKKWYCDMIWVHLKTFGPV